MGLLGDRAALSLVGPKCEAGAEVGRPASDWCVLTPGAMAEEVLVASWLVAVDCGSAFSWPRGLVIVWVYVQPLAGVIPILWTRKLRRVRSGIR